MRWEKEKEAREFIAQIDRVNTIVDNPICRAIGPYEMLKSALEYIQKLENEIDNETGGL